jgi:hypothetical protein
MCKEKPRIKNNMNKWLRKNEIEYKRLPNSKNKHPSNNDSLINLIVVVFVILFSSLFSQASPWLQ